MSSKGDSKPGFFKRLFGSSKKSGGEKSDGSRPTSSGRQSGAGDSLSTSSSSKPKPSHSPLLAPPVKTRTSSSGSSGGGKSPTTTTPTGDGSQPARKPRRQTSGGQRSKSKSQKHRKRTKAMIDPGAIKVSINFFLRASAMLKHVIDIGWTSVCLSVCLSVTRWHGIKTAEYIVMISSPHDSPFILVLYTPRSSRNSDGVTPCGGAKYRWGIKIE